MRSLSRLFDNNRAWAERVLRSDPDFFTSLAKQQSPEYLWIGCADSRVPANQIVGLPPGEVFVHRNVANVVVHTDLNCLSVIQFAVEVLKVRHIMVVGHYGCGGVRAALGRDRLGLVENWLRHVQDVRNKYPDILSVLADAAAQADRLCELNVIEQVVNVCETSILRDAWERGQDVAVHGWIYGIADGLLRDLGVTVGSLAEVEPRRAEAIAALGKARRD
jgi:carbonic anhydrase